MTSYINENSPADTFVGQLTILSADSPVTSITLSGTGAENFKVDNNGTITVAEGAKLDYESNDRYHPQAKAVNAFGESNTANISIYINNVPDRPPVVSGVTSYIDENLPADTFVGQLTIFSADSPVTSITLSGTGAENFKVDNNGTITVAEGAKLDYESARYYSLYAKAVNAFGESNAAYTLIWLNNVPDRPPVVYSIVYYVDENSPADTFIGQLAISDDDSPVTSITLSRTGAENFKVDNNGTITVAEGAKLDYESNYYYHLYAKAVNAFGESNAADILIYLNNVPDNPPVLQDTYLNIHRKTPANKTVGTITVNSPIDCSITKYVIDDNPVFGVRNNGEIYTKTAVMKDSNYAMSVYAKSVCGDSNTVSLTIDTQSSIIGRIKTGGSTYSVVLSSDETKAFVAAYSGGLQIIDVSEPYNPSLIGQIAIGCSTCNNIALSSDNTKAFTTSYNSLMVVDVSEPTNPAIISQIYTGGSTRGGVLSSDDTKAFVTADLGGLRVIDVSDPTNPAIIGQIDIGGSTRDIVLSSDNTKAFVAAYSGGLQIIDVSDPTNPAIISQIYTGGYAYGVVLSSDETKAFVAAYSGGLQIIDVSEPYNPAIIGQIKTGGIAHGVVLSSDDTKAFVTTDSGSLRVIDVSEPTNPATISQIDIGGSTRGVVLSSDDTKAFVTNYYSGGLIIIDIEDFTKD
ncbi:MAG: cadherin domain-containing protein [Helicobacteraceae bacterium]|nr:cadherin domain-containing protein [Helicobacteraceae bacterium]